MSPLPSSIAATRPAFPTDFDAAPFLVIWEVTRACALACVHCRADAIARRDPRELTTAEAFSLIDQITEFSIPSSHTPVPGSTADRGPLPLLVLTGGDPMWRKDLAEIVAHASAAGLSVALTPSGTAAPTRKRLAELHAAGLTRVAVSLDGPDAETHDAFRRVRGSFAYTMKIIESVVDLQLPLQINTTVSRQTLPTLARMADLVGTLPLALWAVFFLVQTGRGASLDQIDARECEQVLRWLAGLSGRVPFAIKTTEAPHYRRVLWEQTRAARTRLNSCSTPEAWRAVGGAGHQSEAAGFGPVRGPALRAPRTVNDGNGFVFVDHVGNICPSGFLPMVCGNVRGDSLVRTYRDDPVFRRLRQPAALDGRCGRCRFRQICGGSRSRAFSATGNAFASDPLCAYQPGKEAEPVIE